MKYFLLVVLPLFVIMNCKDDTETKALDELLENGKLNELKLEKAKQKVKLDSLNEVLAKLSERIEELDTLDKALMVSTYIVKDTLFNHYISVQGNITTEDNVLVSPEFSGTLTLFVREGQNVGRGAVIGQVNDGGLTQSLQEAKIQSDLLRTTYQKQSNLWKQKIGSEMQYLQAKANYEASIKRIQNIQAQLERTKIKAPFSGVVDEVIIQSGQIVGPGAQIVRLINLSSMVAEVELPETYLANVKTGTQTQVTIPALSRSFNSKISKVGNYINPNNRTFKIEIPVVNSDGLVKPNLIAKIKINDYSKSNALVLPKQAVLKDPNNKDFVYIYHSVAANEGVVKRASVVVGKKNDNEVEIIGGLSKGVEVIVQGNTSVTEGEKVIKQ